MHRGKIAQVQLDVMQQTEATTAMQKDCHHASSHIARVLPCLSGSMQMLLTGLLLLGHNSILPVDNESKDKKDNIMAACQAST